jgi:hypothetical protein
MTDAMPRRPLSLLALLGCLALLGPAGCSTTDGTGGMGVRLANLRFTGATAFETTAVFTIRLQNETTSPIRLKGAVHRVTLNGLKIGDGVTNQELDLPGLSSTTQDVEIHFSNLRLATRLKGLIDSRAFDYSLDSTLHGVGPFGSTRVKTAGRLDLGEFQPGSR